MDFLWISCGFFLCVLTVNLHVFGAKKIHKKFTRNSQRNSQRNSHEIHTRNSQEIHRKFTAKTSHKIHRNFTGNSPEIHEKFTQEIHKKFTAEFIAQFTSNSQCGSRANQKKVATQIIGNSLQIPQRSSLELDRNSQRTSREIHIEFIVDFTGEFTRQKKNPFRYSGAIQIWFYENVSAEFTGGFDFQF